MRVGFVVNPIAGMGGRVGLKGTDGNVAAARDRGAKPRAPDRAVTALTAMVDRDPEVTVYTWGGTMGEEEAAEAGVSVVVLGAPEQRESTADDTRAAVEAFIEASVDVIVFVGGDGTAVDVATAIQEAESSMPMVGVPAGVKVYSSVFAVSPSAAGRIAVSFDRTEQREVNDIDEDAYREGTVEPTLEAVATVPVAEDLQGSKQVHSGTVDALARGFAEDVDEETTYIFGPGGTVGSIETELDIAHSPLGVDVWRGGDLLVKDGSASDILDVMGETNEVVVSPIGGQGFMFGRGNDQISPAVIRDSSVTVVASRAKLDDIGVLRVDTGDQTLDDTLRGWQRVRIGRFEHRLLKVV